MLKNNHFHTMQFKNKYFLITKTSDGFVTTSTLLEPLKLKLLSFNSFA